MTKLSKNYKASLEKIWDKKDQQLWIEEAIWLVLETATTKFDSSIEVHINLNVDVKHADQIVRWTISLPHWTWKVKKIAAFVHEENKKKALAAWADLAWIEDLTAEVLKWNIDFDIAIATPDTMKDLWKLAKILWPKWLMPSPKAWTVTQDFEKTIQELKKWKIEFKTDKFWIIHNWIWKVSFGKEKIVENFKTLLTTIVESKPLWIKWKYFVSVAIASTMGPSLMINSNEILEKCK